jgi:hypothetical protein
MSSGAKCPDGESSNTFINGGGTCTKSGEHAECGGYGSGICEYNSITELTRCKCAMGRGCPSCTHPIADILSGAQTCGCDGVKCPDTASGPNGNCIGNGECSCFWPFSGTDCSVNACLPDPCADDEHAVCSVDKVLRTASCECIHGWKKSAEGQFSKCDIEPSCTSNADCAEYPDWACTRGGLTCVDGKYGGTCNPDTGKCACVEGQFTCDTCTAMGDLAAAPGKPGHCALATGGAACSFDLECNGNSTHLLGTGNENQCFQGRCVCKNGYTCPFCNLAQQGIGADQHCPVPPDEADKYTQTQPGPSPSPTEPPTQSPTNAPTKSGLKYTFQVTLTITGYTAEEFTKYHSGTKHADCKSSESTRCKCIQNAFAQFLNTTDDAFRTCIASSNSYTNQECTLDYDTIEATAEVTGFDSIDPETGAQSLAVSITATAYGRSQRDVLHEKLRVLSASDDERARLASLCRTNIVDKFGMSMSVSAFSLVREPFVHCCVFVFLCAAWLTRYC